jgi:tetratricopeptide (TPR) repeat protein
LTIRCRVFALACAASLCCLPAARAQSNAPGPNVAEAKAHFEKGQRLFSVSRYRDALEQFKEGFVAKADPVFLFNIAQCHRLLGEHAEALTFYRRFLASKPTGRVHDDVVRRIHELENESAAAPAPPPVTPPPPPAVARAPEPTPSPRPAPASAVTLSAPPPEPSDPLYKRWWVWAGAAAVVAAGVTTAVLLSGRSSPSPCGEAVDFCKRL